ncbi:haloacid dehalogenase-like hydrolase [Campylobacter concisus]|uniref:haloacid dehalogenase-like hydrolase n=1 Tax=Campylobacter concisus TaxID=199 RepID=UPI001901E1A5|nr:haloacid dehalogenase-like hydrolase [Campylobacter concisus]
MAIAYDFDGTLARGNIQENSFIPTTLCIKKEDFWNNVKELSEENNMDEILSYMYLIVKKADGAGAKITREELSKHGKTVKYFNGVEEFFERINDYAAQKGISIEHYIVSSGTKEMIDGTTIANKFKNIYASSFMYDEYGKPTWPALAINYTTKTQYLYRISKGILNAWDNKLINKYIPENERRILFENMIYIGDGETDVPAMKLLKTNGGTSVAVYDENKETAKTLLEQNRVNYIAKADYTDGSEIDAIIKSTIDRISLNLTNGKLQIYNKQNTAEINIQKSNNQVRDKQYYLSVLKTEGFKLEDTNKTNKIYLKKYSWDDHRYQTSFYIWNNGNYIGTAKIAKLNQNKNEHTADLLEKNFDKLDDDFFSVIRFKKDEIDEETKETLRFLLNDISNTNKYDNNDIVKKSLKRS